MSPLGTLDPFDQDLTRRRFRLAAAAGGWLVTRHPARTAALPRTVGHEDGPITVRREPTRPHAARTLLELDTLLAFGVVPAAVGRSAGSAGAAAFRPWQALAQEADIAVVDATHGVDVERLRAAGVDLVVVSTALASTAPEEIAAYRGLDVPVVRIPDGDVPAQLRLVGAALGHTERAENLAAEVDARFERFRVDRVPSSVAAFTDRGDGGIHVWTPASPVAELTRRVGLGELTCPDGAAPAEGTDTVVVPRDRVRELDAELLLGLETGDGVLAGIEADPRFAALPAVRDRRYRRLDPVSSYAVAVPSVLTLHIALDALTGAPAG